MSQSYRTKMNAIRFIKQCIDNNIIQMVNYITIMEIEGCSKQMHVCMINHRLRYPEQCEKYISHVMSDFVIIDH